MHLPPPHLQIYGAALACRPRHLEGSSQQPARQCELQASETRALRNTGSLEQRRQRGCSHPVCAFSRTSRVYIILWLCGVDSFPELWVDEPFWFDRCPLYITAPPPPQLGINAFRAFRKFRQPSRKAINNDKMMTLWSNMLHLSASGTRQLTRRVGLSTNYV